MYVIKNVNILKTKKRESFLVLTGYYRQFIKDYDKVAQPLTKCLKKDGKIDLKQDIQ